jgi:response regulator RpfG family c-di-GMP phosphodiesterase
VSAAGRRPVLLIVDDEPRILSALRRVLRKEGYEILSAETPEQALALLDERAVDAVLSDHKMAGMSGLQLLSRAAERRPGAARLLISGASDEISRADLERAGVRALVAKPWDDARLKQTLRGLLG